MEKNNDRKAAVKKLKLLAYNGKISVESFRTKIDESFKTVFLPNNVECSEYKYGSVTCDILSPEIYSSNRIMLFVHGGSFVGGSRTAYRSFCSSLATKCFCRVVVPEYRLAPAFPYPAATDDIMEAFKAMFTEEQVSCALNSSKDNTVEPEIIIAADGSGASIALSLLFNLRDRYKKSIKRVVLFSPWLDISPVSLILSAKKMSDEVLSADVIKKSSLVYTFESNTKKPQVSPLLADDELLKDLPPFTIQMGEKEILLEDAKEFSQRLKDNGVEVELDVWPEMMFMFQMAADYLHESHIALDKIGKIVTGANEEPEAIQIENKPRLEYGIRSEA